MIANSVPSPDIRSPETLQPADRPTPDLQFLQVYLEAERSLLLPVQQLVEILTIAQPQVVPLFQMPAWVMGVYNWRGDVLWVVDLNHLLGLTPWYQQPSYGSKHTVVVVREETSDREVDTSADPREKKAVLGLVINRVEGMVIGSNPLVSPLPAEWPDEVTSHWPTTTLESFIRGFWQRSADLLHPVLNGTAIFHAMSKV